MSRPRLKQLAQDGAADGEVITWDVSAGKWIPDAPRAPMIYGQIEVSMTKDENTPYSKIGQASWRTMSFVRYPGSTLWGSVTQVDVIAEQKDGSGSSSVRIYDATNSNVIATVSSINAAGFALYSTSTITNLPSDAAVFEIQAQRASGEGRLANVALVRGGG